MEPQVFLSHCSADAELTQRIQAALEAIGIRCWIAPRDVPAGVEWGEAIREGVDACPIMVVVLGPQAHLSPHVRSEIRRAFDRDAKILTYRLTSTPIDKKIDHFLGSQQWIDGFPDPVENLRFLIKAAADAVAEVDAQNRRLRFGPYLVERKADGGPVELGRGLTGSTFAAVDLRDESLPLVLKVLTDESRTDEAAARWERFGQDARAATRLQHPSIARVRGFGEEKGVAYYAVDRIEGTDLGQLVALRGRVPLTAALGFVAEAAEGLAAAAEAGLLHGNLKPANLRLQRGDPGMRPTVKLTNFWLGRPAAREEAGAQLLFTRIIPRGEPVYLSPEFLRGEETDIRSDIYSLGLVLWFALEGRVPFGGSRAEVLAGKLMERLPVERLHPAIPPVQEILERMTDPNPARRFQRPAEVARSIRAFLETATMVPDPPDFWEPSFRRPAGPATVYAPETETTDSDFATVYTSEALALVAPPRVEESTVVGNLIVEGYDLGRHPDGSLWQIGRGERSFAYKATDRILFRTVVLKFLTLEASRDPGALHRFRREARIAAAVQHPNVASVYHSGETAVGPYYAMEFVEGQTLHERVQLSGPIAPEIVLRIAAQAAEALEAIARLGVVHRDVKPSNLMLATTHDPGAVPLAKLIDFGIATRAEDEPAQDSDSTVQGGFIGTPRYASPEQFGGDRLDARSDIYSLGVTLWFALTGKLPFEGDSFVEMMRQVLTAEPDFDALPPLPTGMRELLQRMLARDRAGRPDSAAALRKEIETVLRGILSPRPERPEPSFAGGRSIPPTAMDLVELSVFAPSAAAPGDTVLVEVWLHEADDRSVVRELMKEMGRANLAGLLAARVLSRGATVEAGLSACGGSPTGRPVQLVWRGAATNATFAISAMPEVARWIGEVTATSGNEPLGTVWINVANRAS